MISLLRSRDVLGLRGAPNHGRDCNNRYYRQIPLLSSPVVPVVPDGTDGPATLSSPGLNQI